MQEKLEPSSSHKYLTSLEKDCDVNETSQLFPNNNTDTHTKNLFNQCPVNKFGTFSIRPP